MATRDLKSFKHYPVPDAERDTKRAQSELYRVITINWTAATSAKKTAKYSDKFTHRDPQTGVESIRYADSAHVHRNVYVFPLPKLLKFIGDLMRLQWAEDIISIEPVPRSPFDGPHYHGPDYYGLTGKGKGE
jgi:hypothetical protein